MFRDHSDGLRKSVLPADVFEQVAFHEVRVPEACANDLVVAALEQREKNIPGSPPRKGLLNAERHGWNALDDHCFDLLPIGKGNKMITGDISEIKKPEVPSERQGNEKRCFRVFCDGHSQGIALGPAPVLC